MRVFEVVLLWALLKDSEFQIALLALPTAKHLRFLGIRKTMAILKLGDFLRKFGYEMAVMLPLQRLKRNTVFVS